MMPLEYVLLTIIQFIVMVMMAVIALRQSRRIASMNRCIEALMQINIAQRCQINQLEIGRGGDDSGSEDQEEVSR